jgi:hypothetical protein
VTNLVNTQNNTTSTALVPTGQSLDYPQGLERLPQLLEEIDLVRSHLEEVGERSLELLDHADRLFTFIEVKVQKARIRERRRVRRVRPVDTRTNGYRLLSEPELSNGMPTEVR